jgi:hypothetical protein
VIKGFLNPSEVKIGIADYQQTEPNIHVEDGKGGTAWFTGSGSNVCRKVFNPKILDLSKQIDPSMDTIAANCLYFSEQTFKYADWDWHLDHDVYYRWQQLHKYFNFFMPLIKENTKLSGMSLIPFDVIKREFTQYYDKLYYSGACRFVPEGNITKVYDDESDEEWELPVNIEDIKISPEIGPGDLLLLVGCVIHHTQDQLTPRLALSMRTVQGSYTISKKKLDSGGVWKKRVIQSTPELLEIYDMFNIAGKEEMTSTEYNDLSLKKYR